MRAPIDPSMDPDEIKAAEKMLPPCGGLGAKQRRLLFRNTAEDRAKELGLCRCLCAADVSNNNNFNLEVGHRSTNSV